MVGFRPSVLFPFGVLCAALAAAVALADESRWNLPILVLMVAFAILGDYLEVEARVLTISGAFLAIGLAMVLLGPVPAVLVALITTTVDAVRRRPALPYVVTNLAGFTVFPLLGGAIAYTTVAGQATLNYAPIVIGAFLAANLLNFGMVALAHRMTEGFPLWR